MRNVLAVLLALSLMSVSAGDMDAKGAAIQVAQVLKQRYGVDINMENYPPTPSRAALARAVQFVQYATIAFALAGQQLADIAGIRASPEFWAGMAEKRWSLVMGAFFFGNTIVNSLLSTGAFEVLYGSDVIFSKLDTGRMPTMQEIVTGMEEAMTAAQ